MKSLIFAIGEDRTLSVFDGISSVQRECEGIDVEKGVWDFYDSKGVPLQPIFHRPNMVRKYLFGLFSSILSSQEFDFAPAAKDSRPTLLACLTGKLTLEKNEYFRDLESVRAHLKNAL